MTISEKLDEVLAEVAFAAPVTIEDCVQVRDALRETFHGSKVEVYCNKDDVVVILVDDVRKSIPVA